MKIQNNYNPDVLSCLANLSSDEVFTPPKLADEILDQLPKPGECCTESWLAAGAFSTKVEAVSFRSYLFTKIVRFLLLQTVVSQHVTKEKFVFVPDLGKYEGEYTDKFLKKVWGITDEEYEFIDSRIK